MTNSLEISGQTILVTGASGFIGSHLCLSLYRNGAEVHGVSRKILHRDEHFLHWWQGDLTDIGTVRNLLTTIKPDIIFHLASLVSGSRDLNMVMPMFQNNLTTTLNFLTIATECGCHRIILTGSMEEPESDSMKIIPSSPYAAAKWSCSAYARMFNALYKTPVVIARLFMVYGPGQKDVSKLVPYVILSLLNNQAPRLSSGTRKVDWIYIEDVVRGLVSLAKTPGIEGETIDLGSGSVVSIRQVVDLLHGIINSEAAPLFGAISDRPLEQVKAADIADTFLKTGWRPVTSLEKGLKLTVEWYGADHMQSNKEG